MRVRDAQTDGGHAAAMAERGLTELLGVTVDFWGGPQLAFTYGLRRPGSSSPDVWGATGPQGAVCRHRRTPAWIEHAQFPVVTLF